MYEDQMEPGFPGMKCDSGDDRVETFPAAGPIPFGRVVATEPEGETAALPAPPYTRLRGAANGTTSTIGEAEECVLLALQRYLNLLRRPVPKVVQ